MSKTHLSALCSFLVTSAIFITSAGAANLTIRYKDGSVQNVPLDAPPSAISQITIGGGETPSHSAGINVVAGSYGQNCGAGYGNKTSHLAAQCNGKKQCNYRIDYTVIGDPAVGCAKQYTAEWRCGSGPVRSTSAPAEAGFGSVIKLSCP